MRVKFIKLNLSFDKDGIGRGFKEGGGDDGGRFKEGVGDDGRGGGTKKKIEGFEGRMSEACI